MSTSELAVTSHDITQPARNAFAAEQWALIKDTVAAGCNDAELAMFLEACARHQLDPLIHQIWVIKIKGKMQTVVARDGFLLIANRFTGPLWHNQPGEFRGCQAREVRAHDSFSAYPEDRPDGTVGFKVEHKPLDAEGKPTHGGPDGSLRGPLVGAWARVRRRDHDDTYYFAQWDIYNKAENAWRTHPEAMIIKCAESYALRKAFSVSGVVGEGEVERSTERATDVRPSEGPEIAWPEDEALAGELKAAFRALGYRRAKVRMRVNACGDEESYRALLEALTRELACSQTEPEEPIEDATVVS